MASSIWRQPVTKFPLIATLLLATVAAAAPAAAKDRVTFTHDGVTYSYTQTKVGESTVIRGRASDGPDFYYVVRKGQVVGKSDDAPVRFSVADAVGKPDASSVTTAG